MRTNDRAAIIDLLVDYTYAIDGRDWQALRSVFLPDASFDMGVEVVQGVEAIIDRISGILIPLDASQHLVSNHQVRVQDDTATCRTYLHAQHVRKEAPGGRHYVIAGRYEDDLVRTEAGWRISHRRLVVVWREGNPAVLQQGNGDAARMRP